MGRPEIADFEDAPAAAAPPPQVFVRTFQTPAALPWDQARAAQMDARHGAPLPLADLMHKVRRLEGWKPGQIARFAVFYVRRRDYTAPFETLIDVDGQSVRVAFGKTARSKSSAPAPEALYIALGVAMSLALAASAGFMAFSARAENEAELARLEQQTAAKLRVARKAQAQRDLVRDLTLATAGAERPDAVLAEVAWVSRAKTADARVVGFHWDHGLVALEARGDGAPVTIIGGELVRSPKPIRPGVWLWGVKRGVAAGGAR